MMIDKDVVMTDDLLPNGVMADTGTLLPGPEDSAGNRIAQAAFSREDDIAAGIKRSVEAESFGVDADTDAEDLAQAGWGIIFPAAIDSAPIEQALAPLIEWRKKEAGERFRIFGGSQGWRQGESAPDWLARQGKNGKKGPGLDLVNPEQGVPYYLLIIGSPDAVPMQFQYLLDIYWAVGRLDFLTLEEYAQYAQSVVDYEKADKPPQLRKQAALFATAHSFDAATTMFTNAIAHPFIHGGDSEKPIGQKQRFKVDPVLGDDATKDAFTRLLRGEREDGPPALLFTGSHGMVFRRDDKRQSECQGALVCQDWEGFGKITESDWFSTVDVPVDARIHGMIHFMFACYGGGWEKFDTFRDGPNGQARQIADRPATARLPQALLAHPKGGALAVLAHVDRAWSYSFRTPQGGAQSTGLREVLTCIMKGQRIGNATDRFNVRWAALSAPIADALRDFQDRNITGAELAKKWIARDDARNYTILGDPAARLRIDDMADAPSTQETPKK
jgi:hypothetical protein